MDEKAFREFLYKNNREAYLKYMRSQQMIPAGWSLLGGGLVLMGGLGTYFAYEGHGDVGSALAWTFMSVGGVSILSSIPILCIGYYNDKKTFSYNKQNSMPNSALSLNLTASQNGVGLALNF